jgi:hypothetical protein
VPTDTVIGFGEYAVVVRPLAPLAIVTVEPPLGAGVGVGVGVVVPEVLLLPHAAIHIAATRIALTRKDLIVYLPACRTSIASDAERRGRLHANLESKPIARVPRDFRPFLRHDTVERFRDLRSLSRRVT